MIICIIWKESSFVPGAQVPPPNTARGLMQVTRGAAKDVGYDYNTLYNPSKNIQAGSKYLKLRITWAGENVAKGLDGYGTGPGYSANILECEQCLKNTDQCGHEKCLRKIHP